MLDSISYSLRVQGKFHPFSLSSPEYLRPLQHQHTSHLDNFSHWGLSTFKLCQTNFGNILKMIMECLDMAR